MRIIRLQATGSEQSVSSVLIRVIRGSKNLYMQKTPKMHNLLPMTALSKIATKKLFPKNTLNLISLVFDAFSHVFRRKTALSPYIACNFPHVSTSKNRYFIPILSTPNAISRTFAALLSNILNPPFSPLLQKI